MREGIRVRNGSGAETGADAESGPWAWRPLWTPGRLGWGDGRTFGAICLLAWSEHMVERQGWGENTEGLGSPILKVLAERYGRCTIVRLADGDELTVYDGTGWGRDAGDMWEHVTARI